MKHPRTALVIATVCAALAFTGIVAKRKLERAPKPVAPVASVCEQVGTALATMPPMVEPPAVVPVPKPAPAKHKKVSHAKPHPPEVRVSSPYPFEWLFGGWS